MRKLTLLTFGLFIVISTTRIQAQTEQKLGLGGQLLSPAGISAKFNLSEAAAITGLTSFRLSDGANQLTLQLNLTKQNYAEGLEVESGAFYVYYGGGAEVVFSEAFQNSFGVRGPVGIGYNLADAPIEFYMDVAPTVGIEPNISVYINSSMGVRIFL